MYKKENLFVNKDTYKEGKSLGIWDGEEILVVLKYNEPENRKWRTK